MMTTQGLPRNIKAAPVLEFHKRRTPFLTCQPTLRPMFAMPFPIS